MKLQLLSRVLISSQLWRVVTSRTRIIGGEEAEAGSFPYTVSFQDTLGHFCGGSLISPDVILSAAHCESDDITAVIGRQNLAMTGTGEEIQVASTLPHPDYDSNEFHSDIMLVFLQEPTEQDTFIRLNSDSSSPGVGSPVAVAGWGLTDENSFDLPDSLMAVEVNTISNEDCAASEGTVGGFFTSYAGEITDDMLCAADVGEDGCQGDSGGPLVREGSNGSPDMQVGVVSWGYGCAHPEFPGVYARVSTFYAWIRVETCKNSAYPPAEFDCDEIEFVEELESEPTPTSTSPCTDSLSWTDSWGDGCEWYEANDSPGCPEYGQSFGGLASENCCYCAGQSTETEAAQPPAAEPSDAPPTDSSCTDTVGWSDTWGDGCEWYEANDSPGCPEYGESYGGANDNCCYCAGESSVESETTWPSVTDPSGTLCTDDPTWTDVWGDNCEFYEVIDLPGCPFFGGTQGTSGTANDNCCYCASTSSNQPTPSPSKETADIVFADNANDSNTKGSKSSKSFKRRA